MDVPRGCSRTPLPARIPSHSSIEHHARSKDDSKASFEPTPPTTSMAIPGTAVTNVPPPLPPTPYNVDLARGIDIAWILQNEGLLHDKSRLPPIKPGSSLFGQYLPLDSPRVAENDMAMDWEFDQPSYRSEKGSYASRRSDVKDTRRCSQSSSQDSQSRSGQRLQGEQPLTQQNQSRSIQAYDQHMLQKISKSTALAASVNSSVQEQTMTSPGHPSHLAGSASTVDSNSVPSSLWSHATQTTNHSSVSSGLPPIRHEHHMFSRYTSSHSPLASSIVDTTDLPLSKSVSHGNSSPKWIDLVNDVQSTRSRSERSSYDIAMDTDGLTLTRSNQSQDMPLSKQELRRPALRLGTKRRALSPAYDKLVASPASYAQDFTQPFEDTPVGESLGQNSQRGSVSSTTSNAYSHSQTPSTIFSAVSSITSATTLDAFGSRQHSDSALSGHGSRPPVDVPLSREVPDQARLPKLSLQTVNEHARVVPTHLGNYMMCSCCPKKPKKFSTQAQLRAHENEKQYACAYCSNRFKNKNEAERHQNSLHLRKQSWSCITIPTYQVVFQPVSALSSQINSNDVCGFCGDEFSNNPVDWEARVEHLTNVHKFGECNSTKKFYRADHFRQHLKHSHAGRSGKWTSILENSCQREETIIPEAPSLSPTTSEKSQLGSSSQP